MSNAVHALRIPNGERHDDTGFVTASVGVSFSGSCDAPSAEAMGTIADRALYLAKARGRNCSHAAMASEFPLAIATAELGSSENAKSVTTPSEDVVDDLRRSA